jgi:hypothetical protein
MSHESILGRFGPPRPDSCPEMNAESTIVEGAAGLQQRFRIPWNRKSLSASVGAGRTAGGSAAGAGPGAQSATAATAARRFFIAGLSTTSPCEDGGKDAHHYRTRVNIWSSHVALPCYGASPSQIPCQRSGKTWQATGRLKLTA